MAERAREQACRFGAEILLAREGVRGEFSTGKRVGYLADGTKLVARSAICATGIEYRRLGLPNEEQLSGAGLYYGAGASEACLCGNEHVFVVGGGNSAAQAALQFARFAKKVTVVIRGESLASTVSSYLVDRISSTKNIEVLTNSDVTALDGDGLLRAITLANGRTGEHQTFNTRWLFICIGGAPRTDWAIEAGVVRRLAARRQASGWVAPRPQSALPRNQHSRSVRRRRCAARLSKALRVRSRRRGHGGHICT